MKRKRIAALGVALIMFGSALLGWVISKGIPGGLDGRALLLTLGLVVLCSGAAVVATALSPSSAAVLRLDVFLPFLRKKKRNEILSRPQLLVRLAQRVLPTSFFADRVTGRPGMIRRFLKWLGPTVLSSPFRRIVQGLCLAIFLLLFFHVCWPYSAKPVGEGNVSAGWRFIELAAETGDLRFENEDEPNWPLTTGQRLHVVEEAASQRVDVGAFDVVESSGRNLTLSPSQPLTADQVDRFLVGQDSWSLHEREPNSWPSHYADELTRKEFLPAESFLAIDPLVGISTSIAARSWVWSLACAGMILLVCVVIPRGFCGYLCPLGTMIDLFDWMVAGRVKRFRVPDAGWWVHIKYYLLTGILVCAVCGVLVSGVFAAIPVVTRAMLFLGEPLQNGLLRRWDLVPAINWGQVLSIGLFVGLLSLGFLRPRFWCKYVCPSGAVFSLGNLFRVSERKVESSCINCNKCVEICPFDAIKADFTTRVTDCTLCQTCGGVCPTQAIKFVDRWNTVELKVEGDPATGETAIGRRGFLSLAVGSAAAAVGGVTTALVTSASGAQLNAPDAVRPVRPPGSVPEKEFLQMCIRCGECFKACPNNVLQAEGFQQGFEGLWAPLVNADWAGCESSCNACGQVCPTGAIRDLPLEEKKVARMGLAVVDQKTCLPFAGQEACDLCVVECKAAGYRAIEFLQVHTQVDDQGTPLEGSGFLAPVVLADKCVGCGLCQTRCHLINVKERGILDISAIIVEAGEDKEDRIMSGSYIALREKERMGRHSTSSPDTFFVPGDESEQVAPPTRADDPDPFGSGEEQPGRQKSDKKKADSAQEDDPFGTGNQQNNKNKSDDQGGTAADPFGLGK